ncbi:MAG: rhodanese-like domain-containing protein [Micromonosporaceae bacterium]
MFQSPVPSVTVDQVPDGAFLLDVREPDEWAAGRAPGARHVPMQDVPRRLDEVPAEGDVVVACRVGGRSAQVVAFLHAQGRANAVNLDGGMQAWAEAGRPIVADGEESATII